MDEEDLSKYLTNLKHEVHHHKETLNNILVEVGWNPVTSDTVTEKMCWCVHDSHHRMPLKSLKNHTSVCSSNHLTAISPQERLALYRKAVEDKSQPVLEVDDIRTVLTKNGDIDKKNEAASFLEELQRQRDLKRRRIAYRKRGAHTAKKNKTEKMRDLIESMMDSLKED